MLTIAEIQSVAAQLLKRHGSLAVGEAKVTAARFSNAGYQVHARDWRRIAAVASRLGRQDGGQAMLPNCRYGCDDAQR